MARLVEDLEGTESMEDQGESVITLYFEDHDRIKKLFHEFKSPGISDSQRRAIVDDLIKELTSQSAAEFEVLCPVLAERLGTPLADHLASELASLKLVMGDLQALEVAGRREGFYSKVEQLMEVVMGHIHVQEHKGLRRLRSLMNSASLADLGKAYAAAKAQAPTDPSDLQMGENEGEDEGDEGEGSRGDEPKSGPEHLAPAGPREGQVAA